MVVFPQNTKLSYPHWKINYNGMMTKCGVALKLAGDGMPVVIANGKRDDVILHIIDGDSELPCTRFVPEKI